MKNKCLFFTLVFFLFVSTNYLFSSGKQEAEFYDIDEKIQDKQYNDALLLLNQYIKENPENFDNVQKRVNDIMDVRSEYAKLAEEIIYVIINEPTNDEKKLMILSLKAGGTGLNLTAASNVIHYDLWWNPAVENQATDRTYRIGQDKNIMVHRLITMGTFEEKIDDMLKAKTELVDMSLFSGEQNITELSDKEILEIFSLNM